MVLSYLVVDRLNAAIVQQSGHLLTIEIRNADAPS